MKSTVCIISSPKRQENIKKVLSLLSAQIKREIEKKKKIVIKPNLVTWRADRKGANTHPEALRAVLESIIPLKPKGVKMIIAEECASSNTREVFKTFGYDKIANEYNVDLFALEEDDFVTTHLYSKSLKRDLVQHIYKTFLDKNNFILSIGPPKTHDAVILTLSLKNVVIAAIKEKYKTGKTNFHQGPRALNLSIAALAKHIKPNLAVIDAFEAMEGNGPTAGNLVPLHLALASLDFLAADSMMARLMGFDPQNIGYLFYCHQKKLGKMDLDQINILSNTIWQKHQKRFQPHMTYFFQKRWRIN